jgi:Na+-driven multidrug efflux pump
MSNQSATTNAKTSWIQRLYSFVSHGDAVTLVKMSIPLAISYILSLSTITSISLIFMGHLGQAELNASSLANTVFVLICYGLMAGINFGCDTLLPQYYGGDKKKMGIILQRGIIIAGYVCFISWILMLNAVSNTSEEFHISYDLFSKKIKHR